ILLAIIQPVWAIDPVITINVPVAEEPTDGFSVYPEGTTFQQGQNISFFNNDRNRRWFTLICDKNIFVNEITGEATNESYMSFRQRTRLQLDEPGVYNFHLLEKPTVTIRITVIGDNSGEIIDTQDIPKDLPDTESNDFFKGLGELPGPGILTAFMVLILAFLTHRTKE
ncbi:MAG: hypothetical protein K8R19_02225, partial [Methanosarcinales archaeon]|nr:hypothetical protein [Methanosarcinales archaeon]